MQVINRRAVVLGLTLFPAAHGAWAGETELLSVAAQDGDIGVTRYAGSAAGRRGAVLLLPGTRGFDPKPVAYQRYASALTAKGIDAYFVSYQTAADAHVLATSSRDQREAFDAARFGGWAQRTSAVITSILARPESSGRIGLLGFSLGGYVAAATAALDERVAALAVLYGGLPQAMLSEVKHLPPLLELHGEADVIIPLRKGEELVEVGKRIGGEAELVTYPGRKHGFDFSDTDPATSDAVGRVIRFFAARLRV
jgi:carboxymethylenebutenolidase